MFKDKLQKKKMGMLVTKIWKTESTTKDMRPADCSMHELKRT